MRFDRNAGQSEGVRAYVHCALVFELHADAQAAHEEATRVEFMPSFVVPAHAKPQRARSEHAEHLLQVLQKP